VVITVITTKNQPKSGYNRQGNRYANVSLLVELNKLNKKWTNMGGEFFHGRHYKLTVENYFRDSYKCN